MCVTAEVNLKESRRNVRPILYLYNKLPNVNIFHNKTNGLLRQKHNNIIQLYYILTNSILNFTYNFIFLITFVYTL
jgi:hypothetical protein